MFGRSRTTKGVAPAFSLDPSGDGAITAWRYAYDDAGDLVGTSDARGCGSNFHYDSAGRLLAEDYSPCLDIHPPYSTPDLASGVGAEVFYVYDGKDADSPPEPAAPTAEPPPGQLHIDGSLLLGRLASVTDRASKTVTSFDGRGRVIGVGRKIAAPKAPSDPDDPNRFQTRWYTSYTTYDGADRPVNDSTGAERLNLQGTDNKSVVTSVYGDRGTVKRVLGSYGVLVGRVTHDADGLVGVIEYGDLAKTSTAYSYDNRRRVHSVQTYRGPPDPWKASPHPETQQTLLEDLDYTYDVVDNPTEIRDWRVASEWPDGAKPVSRKIAYDDLYRATQVDYLYAAGTDDWTSPFAADLGSTDPLRPKPSPHVAFDKRVLEQTFTYDWLGNTTHTGDDASGFYDRSLGAVTNDPAKRYQLKSATQAGPRGGSLGATYDDAGNLVALDVVRSGPCLPTAASCEQKLRYDWDEVGRLQRARRFDGAGTASGTPAVELRYAYDAHDQRVRKTAVDGEGSERHTVYVFDSLELRRAAWTVDPDTAKLDYERTDKTETVYLLAHGVRLARLAYHAPDSLPGGVASVTDGLHVFLELGDHLGSTAIVLDKNTGELVEAGTYTAYGSAESDYRPERWGGFREDYRFTGKEEDSEVGLTYFGKRYLSPYLGRWVSADPLTVHAGGADLNAYAYVHARLLVVVDPLGLEDDKTPRPAAGSDPPPPPVPGSPDAVAADAADAKMRQMRDARAAARWNADIDNETTLLAREARERRYGGEGTLEEQKAAYERDVEAIVAARELLRKAKPSDPDAQAAYESEYMWAVVDKIRNGDWGGQLATTVPGLGGRGRAGGGARGGANSTELGKQGEAIQPRVTGLGKNTQKIPAESGKKQFRIPDGLESSQTQAIIAETKNVAHQYLSSQLKDDKAVVVGSGGGRVTVLIDKNTTISLGLLREHLDPGSPIKITQADLRGGKL